MPSVDISIHSNSVASSVTSSVTPSSSAGSSASAAPSPSDSGATNKSSRSGKSAQSNGKANTKGPSNANKETKQSDAAAAASTTAGQKQATPATGAAVDTSKDFLSTLATLLDEGTTTVPQAVTNTIKDTTATTEQKLADVPADTQAATIEAMLFGAPLIPSTTPVTPAPVQANGDRTAADDVNGVAANIGRSLSVPAASVLNDTTSEVATFNATAASLGLATNAVGSLTEARKENVDTVDNATMPNAPTQNGSTSMASETRANSEQQVREQGSVDARVGTPKWTDELATRVSVLSQRDIHAASLRLSPEHLGPLEIQITVQNDKTSVWFGAAHAETRAALEQALPRLRELLSSQGLTLTDSGVFREPPRDQTRGYQGQNGLLTDNNADTTRLETDLRIKLNRSLLDAYA